MKILRKIKQGIPLLWWLLLSLCACTGVGADISEAEPMASTQGEPPQKVVALSSSLSEIWLLAGGTLVGITSDTPERGFEGLPEDTAVVGTVKDPSIEAILALQPDFVILSEDISGQVLLAQPLTDAGITHYYAHVETFADYFTVLTHFCGMTGNTELLTANGTAVNEQIDRLLTEYSSPSPSPSYLLMRVHSSGGKVIANDHVAYDILSDLSAVNIAERSQSLLSDLSLEAILESDPDYIFVVTMGDEEVALQTFSQMFMLQPAWQTLNAVSNERVYILPKELFHYKPNAKWGEAYQMLAELLAD